MPTQQARSQTSSDPLALGRGTLCSSLECAVDAQTVLVETTAEYVDRWKRGVQLALAGVFFCVGVLGAILPLLPATPFLLLASYFLSKSSPRLNRVLLRSRMFGSILRDWQQRGGIRRSVRIKATVAVVLAVTATLLMSGFSPQRTLAVVLLALIGIIVVLRLPAADESDTQPHVA